MSFLYCSEHVSHRGDVRGSANWLTDQHHVTPMRSWVSLRATKSLLAPRVLRSLCARAGQAQQSEETSLRATAYRSYSPIEAWRQKMQIQHRGATPHVDATAWVAPTAVVSGAVTVGPRARILHGAVVTAEGDTTLTIGPDCVIMEQA